MPNDSWNIVRIYASEQTIDDLKKAEFSFELLHPPPQFSPLPDLSGEDDRWYYWNTEHWGTKWDRYEYSVETEGPRVLVLRFTTAWTPPYGVFQHLLKLYPDLWLRCNWTEESGMKGVFIGCTKNNELSIKELQWEDWCFWDFYTNK
jgi:hypothetical protein